MTTLGQLIMGGEFDHAAQLLATSRGGFTIWLGAGVSQAITRGKTPGWGELVRSLVPPGNSAIAVGADLPGQLEAISELIGHQRFRRALRERLMVPLSPENIDIDVCAHMAVIGSRASAFVSFNLEELTAIPFVTTRGTGTYCTRVFAQQLEYEHRLSGPKEPGPFTIPVYFPHGLLSQGRVTLTRSEYDQLQAGVAMMTAINVALGGTLVILGMSLDDDYLRSEISRHRPWFQDIFWFNKEFHHTEWARVAHVTTVEVAHQILWPGLADAFVSNDTSGRLSALRQGLNDQLRATMSKTAEALANIELTFSAMEAQVSDDLARPGYPAKLRRFFVDAGCHVPEWLEDACIRVPAQGVTQ